jgi:hypothetical protein
MDRFSLRSKPIMDQLHQLEMAFEAVVVRAQVGRGLTLELCGEAIGALDKILELQKSNPDFFDPDDSKEVTDLRTRIFAVFNAIHGR